jgi:outer membrane protein OmpA-like peptidoglycan-associated protein
MKSRFALVTATAALLLGACATQPGTPTGPGAPAPSSTSSSPFGNLFGSGLSPALEAQRTRLKEALAGTPVVIEATGDKTLRVEVPMKYSFDAGRAAVKPALGAALDQLAIGFKPYAANTEIRIGAPADEGGSAALGDQRAAAVKQHLLVKGIVGSRIASAARGAAPGVEIVIADRPAGSN